MGYQILDVIGALCALLYFGSVTFFGLVIALLVVSLWRIFK